MLQRQLVVQGSLLVLLLADSGLLKVRAGTSECCVLLDEPAPLRLEPLQKVRPEDALVLEGEVEAVLELALVAGQEFEEVGSEMGEDLGGEVLEGEGEAVEVEIRVENALLLGPFDESHSGYAQLEDPPVEPWEFTTQAIGDLHILNGTKLAMEPDRS